MSEKVLDIMKSRKIIAYFLLALVILISLNTVVARAQLLDESSESLELLLWLVIPLLAGFFTGILIGGALNGLLAGAIGAVISCFIVVQIIYGMGYVVVKYDFSTGTTTELTAFLAFVDAIFSSGGIILGAIAGTVGGWLGKRKRKKPVSQIPETLFFCPKCGRRLSLHAVDVDKFCPYCGNPLGEKMRARTQTCPSCGYENPPYAKKFCTECGSQLKIEVESSERTLVLKTVQQSEAAKRAHYYKRRCKNSAIWGTILAFMVLLTYYLGTLKLDGYLAYVYVGAFLGAIYFFLDSLYSGFRVIGLKRK